MGTAEKQVGERKYKLFINGEFVDASSGKTFALENPATGEHLAEVAEGGAEDVDRAVRAALAAFPDWSRRSAAARAKLLYKLAQRVEEERERLATIETVDVGKPIRDTTRVDLVTAVDALEYFAGMATKVHGDVIPVPGPFYNLAVREPLGVIGGITPWNYPLLQAIWKIAPAVAAGNTIVLKPAEQACLSVLELARLAAEVGFPPGVINVVTGYGEVAGDALVRHPGVAKILFTGETTTGQLIARNAAETLKSVALELGGKTAVIVYEDADVTLAARTAARAILTNTGQNCTAGSRLVLHKRVADAVLSGVVEEMNRARLGDPLDPETTMGPVISAAQLQRVRSYVESGLQDGAILVRDGRNPGLAKGYWFGPTVLDQVRSDMKVAQDEIFGPVLCVFRFEDEAEAIQIANDTRYGLAASIITNNLGRALRTAQAMQAGNVWVNTWGAVSSQSPYGGYKMSGYGREMGFDIMHEVTQVKSIWLNMR